MERIFDCTGVLLAGGMATRLGGIPKGLLRVGSETVAARSLRLFDGLFGALLIVANDPAPYRDLDVAIVPDLFRGKGAPGGLHAALSTARTGWVFVAGCDMPLLSREAISFLWERRADAAAVAVEWERGFEGLHAFWSRRCLPTVERMLAGGIRRFEPSPRPLGRGSSRRPSGGRSTRPAAPSRTPTPPPTRPGSAFSRRTSARAGTSRLPSALARRHRLDDDKAVALPRRRLAEHGRLGPAYAAAERRERQLAREHGVDASR